MKLPARIIEAIISYAMRTPYEHLTGYMERYFLLKPRRLFGYEMSARVHHILRSDTDRHLHDHPFNSVSVILKGGYWETLPFEQRQHPYMDSSRVKYVWRGPGTVTFRKATDRHAISIPNGETAHTIFIFVGKHRDWGFWPPTGWVFWKEYLGIDVVKPAQTVDLRIWTEGPWKTLGDQRRAANSDADTTTK